ncbi:hypothetical protein HJFPF1_05656 [Paramyrothecium foliicola]|nr:hypothetical protein HJFPF1_05656 [Paramyrothecium foliicola]
MSDEEKPDAIFPSSQSHFAKFEGFTPNESSSFNVEFASLALSQNWIPGSQQYTEERTIALREELKRHYFPRSKPDDVLAGYQALCQEVGLDPGDSIIDCKRILKTKLVNIVDLIDARRTGKKVEIWEDFEKFRKYTLKDEHRISVERAKEDGGYLASLLQRLREPRMKQRSKRHGPGAKVRSGRVAKPKAK